MKIRKILLATVAVPALCLGAQSQAAMKPLNAGAQTSPIIHLAQAETPADCPEGQECETPPAAEAAPPPAEEQPAPEAAPEAEPAAEAAPEPAAEAPAAEAEAPAAEEVAPVAEEAAPAAEEVAPVAEEAAPAAEAEIEVETEVEPAPEAESAPAEQAAPEASSEEAPAAEAAPVEEAPANVEAAPAEEAAPEANAAPEAEPAKDAKQVKKRKKSDSAEAPSTDADTSQDAAGSEQAQPEEEISTEERLSQPDAAPVLDSAKEEPADGEQTPAQAEAEAQPAAPPPTSDAEAQERGGARDRERVKIRSANEDEGRRLDRAPDRRSDNRNGRDGRRVISRDDDRALINIDGRIIIENNDRRRLSRQADEVYYEELRRGRVRETVVRPNGVRIVTIRDRNGEIIQRSRIGRNGNEVVLYYAPVDQDSRNDRGDRDGRDGRRNRRDRDFGLPPMRLNVPIDNYILDATRADRRRYFDFLAQPPVEQVERVYRLDDVKHSARLRDKLPRVDLDTVTFDTGSAQISNEAAGRLRGVADAMLDLIDRNPAETFLIEGHTDAVGGDESNLVLSDARAETVAIVLSDAFGVPPENLTTQGYGERFLKIRTPGAERLNRRVTIRRITPLVRPVAAN